MTKILKVIAVLVTLLVGSASFADADESGSTKWTPLPMDEIRKTINSTELSDAQKVTALTRHLDKRISMEFVKRVSEHEANLHYMDYARLIGFMSLLDRPVKAPRTPEPIQEALDKLDSMTDIVNKERVRVYLYIALGKAGGNPPERVLLTLLNDTKTPNWVLCSVLGAMQNSKVPLRALPRLLELVSDHWNYVQPAMLAGGTDDLGRRLDESRLIFPLREIACEVLQKLGVQSEKTLVEGDYDPKLKRRLPITVIKVDRRSSARALEQLRRGG